MHLRLVHGRTKAKILLSRMLTNLRHCGYKCRHLKWRRFCFLFFVPCVLLSSQFKHHLHNFIVLVFTKTNCISYQRPYSYLLQKLSSLPKILNHRSRKLQQTILIMTITQPLFDYACSLDNRFLIKVISIK